MTRGKKNPLHFGLPARLEAARLAVGYAYHTLALDAGMSNTAAQRIAVGHAPRIDTVERLADILKISPSFLAYGQEHQWGPVDVPRHEGTRLRLERLRRARGMSCRALGRASGTSDTAVRTIEGGTMPGVDTVEKLAKGLKCSPGWLAYGEGAEPQAGPAGSGTMKGRR